MSTENSAINDITKVKHFPDQADMQAALLVWLLQKRKNSPGLFSKTEK